MKKGFFTSLTDVKKFEDDERNRTAEIINVVGMALLTGLLLMLVLRLIFEEIPYLPQIIAIILVVSGAMLLLRRGKLYLSALIIVHSLLLLVVFLSVKYDGIHDYSLFAIPGLLVLAVLVLPKRTFYSFLALCFIAIAVIGILEINGIINRDAVKKIKILDIVDILIIFSLTAMSIRLFSEKLKSSLIIARENEKVLRDNELKQRILLSALPDIVFRIDSDGVFKDFSVQNQGVLLYKSEEFIGKKISELLPPDISAKSYKAIQSAIASGKVEQFEYTLKINNQDTDWEARFVALDDKEAVIIIRDITERKRTEAALKLSEEIFRAFMEYSPIYVFFKDHNTRAVRLSRNYEQLLNMPLNQILGKTMYEIFPSDLAKSMTEDDLNIIKNGKMVRVFEELNGRHYETIKFPIALKDSPMYLAGFTIDITETKNYELQLKQYTEELKEANLSKEKFLSIIAHDLRSPFLGILGSIQMLSTEYQMLTDDERRLLIDRVSVSTRKTFDLLENLLNWSRVQSGKILPIMSEVNLIEELAPTINLLKDSAVSKNISIENSIDPAHSVTADKDMLRTVIRNIVSNAVKFSLPSGKVIIRSFLNDNLVTIKIEDTGIGMDGETLSNLFKPEFAQSRLGTANESGTGIGLLVCKEMIDLNGGEIKVESREGRGTVFYITFSASH